MLTHELKPFFTWRRTASLRPPPPGAKAQVVRDTRSLGIHHFAFVRSSLLGLDLRDAFTRYLAWSDPNSSRNKRRLLAWTKSARILLAQTLTMAMRQIVICQKIGYISDKRILANEPNSPIHPVCRPDSS